MGSVRTEESTKGGRAGESRSLAELQERVERATKLIAKLRESNYSLTGELASLQRKVALLESEAKPPPPTPPAAPDGSVHEELQLLRDERKIVRAKVQNLLERLERLEL